MTTETPSTENSFSDLFKNRWYPRSMHKVPLTIGEHTWQLIISRQMEMGFYKEVIEENDEDPLMWDDWDGEWSPYFTVPSIADNILPAELSAVTVMRKIIRRLIGMIHQYNINFFYFQPGTGRKARFFKYIFQRYLPELRGSWSWQVVDNYYYFTRTDSPHLN